MWPLSIFLLLAMNAAPAPQQNAPAPQGPFIGKIPQPGQPHRGRMDARSFSPEDANRNLCFTIRSYHFRRQDGQAPVPAGVTTCTPANALRQRRVSPAPGGLYVPLGMPKTGEDGPGQ